MKTCQSILTEKVGMIQNAENCMLSLDDQQRMTRYYAEYFLAFLFIYLKVLVNFQQRSGLFGLVTGKFLTENFGSGMNLAYGR